MNTVDALKDLYKTLCGKDYTGDPNPTDAEMISAIAKDATTGGGGTDLPLERGTGANSWKSVSATTASGANSHAEGSGTIAASNNQHVQGTYNIEDNNNKYAHIVGNGTRPNARSNCHTIDWNGNAWFAGNLTLGNVTITSAQLSQLLGTLS